MVIRHKMSPMTVSVMPMSKPMASSGVKSVGDVSHRPDSGEDVLSDVSSAVASAGRVLYDSYVDVRVDTAVEKPHMPMLCVRVDDPDEAVVDARILVLLPHSVSPI